MKKYIATAAVLLLGLFFMGMTGLVIGLSDANDRYVLNKESVRLLAAEVDRMKDEIAVNSSKLNNYKVMEFKLQAFSKQYRLFSRILDVVYRKSMTYGFHPDLIVALMKVESDFIPTAVSYKGAYGLMQVNVPVWSSAMNIDRQRIFDVEYNIELGLRILKHYHRQCRGNMERAIHRYNNGYLYNNMNFAAKVIRSAQPLKPVAMEIPTGGISY